MKLSNLWDKSSKKAEVIEQPKPIKKEIKIYSRSIQTEFNESDIINLPEVKRSLERICGAIASMPIYKYKESKKGEVDREFDYREKLLNEKYSNFHTDGWNLKYNMAKDILLYGRTLSLLDKDKNKIKGIVNIPNNKYKLEGSKNKVTGIINGVDVEYNLNDVKNNLKIEHFLCANKGKLLYPTGILSNKKILELANKQNTMLSNILDNVKLPGVIIKSERVLNDSDKDDNNMTELDYVLESVNGILDGNIAMLPQGVEIELIKHDLTGLNLNENKEQLDKDIRKLFNLEGCDKQEDFLNKCLIPILNLLESAINNDLLLESEKEQGYYFRFDTSELLRASVTELADTFDSLSPVMTINEIRAKLDYPPIKNGDVIPRSLGEILHNVYTGETYVPNTDGGKKYVNDEKIE